MLRVSGGIANLYILCGYGSNLSTNTGMYGASESIAGDFTNDITSLNTVSYFHNRVSRTADVGVEWNRHLFGLDIRLNEFRLPIVGREPQTLVQCLNW